LQLRAGYIQRDVDELLQALVLGIAHRVNALHRVIEILRPNSKALPIDRVGHIALRAKDEAAHACNEHDAQTGKHQKLHSDGTTAKHTLLKN
jgi:hypothetical protein